MNQNNKYNYYVEPVEIEIYLKKAGTVKTIVKELVIELVDVVPELEFSKKMFKFFIEKDEPIDLIEAQNYFPEIILPVSISYYQTIELYEKLSIHIKTGLGGSNDSWRQCIYFTELLMKYEPTLASLEYLGDFHTYNLNYLIRKLNSINEHFILEDSTVAYLIKRKREAYKDMPTDKEFDKLVELWEYNLKEKLI